MIEAVRTSETSVDNHFTRQYIPEDNSEHHTRRRENLKSHREYFCPENINMEVIYILSVNFEILAFTRREEEHKSVFHTKIQICGIVVRR
jgi:hypothetical protein